MPPSNYTMSSLASFVDQAFGTSEWTTVTQDMINTFAQCSGDNQWIHVDVERAKKESPFGGPIAHGYLTLSLIAKFAMDLGIAPVDAAAALNYGLDKVRFLTPVKAGARVRGVLVITEVTDQGKGRWLLKVKNTVEIEGEPKPALIAESLVMLVAKA